MPRTQLRSQLRPQLRTPLREQPVPAGPAGRRPALVGPPAGRRDTTRPGMRAAELSGAREVRGGGCAEVGGTRWAGVSPVGGRGGRAPLRPGVAVAELRPDAPVRLTRRGRRVVAGLSVAIGLTVAAGTAVVASAHGQPFELAGATTVVVQPGDTLWEIARTAEPDEDTRAVVDAIVDLNHLGGGEIMAGQVLQLP